MLPLLQEIAMSNTLMRLIPFLVFMYTFDKF